MNIEKYTDRARGFVSQGLETPDTGLWAQFLLRISPNDLFAEAMQAILSPQTRTLGAVFIEQLRGALARSISCCRIDSRRSRVQHEALRLDHTSR